MFCKSQNADLQSTVWEDERLMVWKEYENSILMIAISKDLTEKVLRNLIDMCVSALILYLGIDEVRNLSNSNIERFKRELKNYYQLVDKLMEIAENDFLGFNEGILCHEASEIQQKLVEFSEIIFSPYCCLMIRNKVVCGTEAWMDLDATDRKLLILILSSSNSLQKDYPVYLPHKSPNIAFRLISLSLTHGTSVAVLAGVQPSFSQLELQSQQFFQNEYELLLQAETSHPKNFPTNVEIDPNILGFLLINKPQSKFVMSRNNVQQVGKKPATQAGRHRLDILRTFFHQTVDVMQEELGESTFFNDNVKNSEQYWIAEYHKCHALITDENVFCVLYTASVPSHTMRYGLYNLNSLAMV